MNQFMKCKLQEMGLNCIFLSNKFVVVVVVVVGFPQNCLVCKLMRALYLIFCFSCRVKMEK